MRYHADMKNTARIALILAALLSAAALIGAWGFVRSREEGSAAQAPRLVASVTYACDGGRGISAEYYEGASKPGNAGEPPVPGGSVALSLSDGRSLTLPQTISASGIRYANADESVLFWSKGRTAFMTEGGAETYGGCLEVAADSGGLPNAYASSAKGFSLRYPAGYTADESYSYQLLGPGKGISGVKFQVPAALAEGTNLSADTYLSVETMPGAQTCSAGAFLPQGVASAEMTDSGTTYSVATSSEAAAGNRYEETVYAIPGTNPCVAVRYFIHYGVFENYPAGSVQEFDRQALLEQFDAMRQTLTIGQ